MKRYLRINYFDNDYTNYMILVVKLFISNWAEPNEYDYNKTSFFSYFHRCFCENLDVLARCLDNSLKYSCYLQKSVENRMCSCSIAYNIECSFRDTIDENDNNSQTIYIDICAGKYYII